MDKNRYLRVGKDVYIDQFGSQPPNWSLMLITVGALLILCAAVGVSYRWQQNLKHHRQLGLCQSNLKVMVMAFSQYAEDNDSHWPPVRLKDMPLKQVSLEHEGTSYGWADAIAVYVAGPGVLYEGAYQCPMHRQQLDQPPAVENYSDYWYNRHLAGCIQNRIAAPNSTLLLGEGDMGTTPASLRYSLDAFPHDWLADQTKPSFRHEGGANYAFADGHVKWLRPTQVKDFTFRPAPNIRPRG